MFQLHATEGAGNVRGCSSICLTRWRRGGVLQLTSEATVVLMSYPLVEGRSTSAADYTATEGAGDVRGCSSVNVLRAGGGEEYLS